LSASQGADYSVPPGLARRRVQIPLSAKEVRIFLEGRMIAQHQRSYVFLPTWS